MHRRIALLALALLPLHALAGSPEDAKKQDDKKKQQDQRQPTNPGKPKKGDRSAPFDETEYRRRFRWPVR